MLIHNLRLRPPRLEVESNLDQVSQILHNLGTSVSGDENLFLFTSKIPVMLCLYLEIPLEFGLWMYQVVAQHGNYLLVLINPHAYAQCACPRERRNQSLEGHYSGGFIPLHAGIRLVLLPTCSQNVIEEPLANGRLSNVRYIGAFKPTTFSLCKTSDSPRTVWTGYTTATQVTF